MRKSFVYTPRRGPLIFSPSLPDIVPDNYNKKHTGPPAGIPPKPPKLPKSAMIQGMKSKELSEEFGLSLSSPVPIRPEITEAKSRPETNFGSTSMISGYNEDNPVKKDVVAEPSTEYDTILPESKISLDALNAEEFKGVDNPYSFSNQTVNEMKNQEEKEIKSNIETVKDIVKEAEMLTGGKLDSLFNVTDVHLENRPELNDVAPAIAGTESGYTRGQQAHEIQEVDMSNFTVKDGSMSKQIISGMWEIADDIGGSKNITESWKNRSFGDDGTNRGMSDMSDISSEILGFLKLTQDNLYGEDMADIGVDKPLNYTERMGKLNIGIMNKNFDRRKIKYNNNNDSIIQSIAPDMMIGNQSVSEVRGSDIPYKQPTRSYKNNAVNLVRLGNQTSYKINNQFAP